MIDTIVERSNGKYTVKGVNSRFVFDSEVEVASYLFDKYLRL